MNEGIPLLSPHEPDRPCTECSVVKPAEAFHRMGHGKRRSQCAECRAANRASRAGGPPTRTREARREQHLRETYGLSVEAYEDILVDQGGVCAICAAKPEANAPLSVDHCHATGRVRALLCPACNTKLGGYEVFRTQGAQFLARYGQGNPLLYP